MSWDVSEANISRSSSSASVRMRFHIRGDGGDKLSDTAALAALLANSDATYAGLFRSTQDCYVDEDEKGGGLWNGTVLYLPNTILLAIGEERFNFTTAGGTQHIVFGRETIASYGPDDVIIGGGADALFRNLIGYSDDGSVAGTDIGVEVFDFEITRAFSSASQSFQNAIAAATWHTNDDAFRGYAAGEVVFRGANGGQRPDGIFEITFGFSRRPNRTGITIGEIIDIAVKGWQIIWVYYTRTTITTPLNLLVERPTRATVERVYDETDFANLLIDQ